MTQCRDLAAVRHTKKKEERDVKEALKEVWGNDLKVTAPLSGKMSQLDFKMLYRYPKFLRFEVLVTDLLEEKFQEVFPVFPVNLTVLGNFSKRVPGNLDF